MQHEHPLLSTTVTVHSNGVFQDKNGQQISMWSLEITVWIIQREVRICFDGYLATLTGGNQTATVTFHAIINKN
jgi:hypothetical protein